MLFRAFKQYLKNKINTKNHFENKKKLHICLLMLIHAIVCGATFFNGLWITGAIWSILFLAIVPQFAGWYITYYEEDNSN